VARTRGRTQDTLPPHRLILDRGAVIALARQDQRARAVLTAAWEAGVEVAVPSLVVAETTRGSARDAGVNRVLHAVGKVTAADEATGRLAGSLLGAAGSIGTVDAIVVASAIAMGGGVVLTGDADDLRALASRHPEVVVQPL